MSQSANSFHLRLPPNLKDQLDLACEANGSSLNREIVERLMRTFEPDLALRLADDARPLLATLDAADSNEVVALVIGMLKIASKGQPKTRAKPRRGGAAWMMQRM